MTDEKKNTTTALARQIGNMPLVSLAEHFAKSGYFKNASDVSQAVVKIAAGQELGIGPVASMSGIHIVEGKPTLGANLMASLVRTSGKYDYQIMEFTDEKCVIQFHRTNGEILGVSPFSMKDAEAAGLAGKFNWKAYRRNMLFSRAISNGIKWFCPDVTVSPIYTPEELNPDARVTEDGEVVEGEVVDPAPVAALPPADPLGAVRDKMVAAFAKQGVALETLVEFCGCPVNELTAENIERLKGVFAEVREGKRGKDLAETKTDLFPDAPKEAPKDEEADMPASVDQNDIELRATLKKVRARDSRAFDQVLQALAGLKWAAVAAAPRDVLVMMANCSYVKDALKKGGA